MELLIDLNNNNADSVSIIAIKRATLNDWYSFPTQISPEKYANSGYLPII